jgi:hypothetical protein
MTATYGRRVARLHQATEQGRPPGYRKEENPATAWKNVESHQLASHYVGVFARHQTGAPNSDKRPVSEPHYRWSATKET